MKSAILRYYRESILEIAVNPALRFYGMALAFTHLLTVRLWLNNLFFASHLNVGKEEGGHMCWSFAPWCRSIHLSVGATRVIGVLYVLLALATIYAFAKRKFEPAWWLLLGLFATKLAITLIDFRLMGNYHYMPQLTTLAYLFIPGRATMCRLLLAAFYMSAGVLKFNPEWLSGRLIGHPYGLHGIVLEWLCAYVVLLETCMSFGLLSSRPRIRMAALAQFAAFHIFSIGVVGYYFPSNMAMLLLIFPLAWWNATPLKLRTSHAAILAALFIAQAIQQFQHGDPVLVGRGRVFSLNMLDAQSSCIAQFFVRYDFEQFEIVPSKNGVSRNACDPLMFWNFGRYLCESNKGKPRFRDIDLLVSSKRSTSAEFTPIVSAPYFCERAKSYSTIFKNEWNELE